MIRPRASLFALLLALAPAAWADTITVTTVVDEDSSTSLNPNNAGVGCSLREAVAYMALPADSRKNGYGGCKTPDTDITSDVINLPAAKSLDSSKTFYQLTRGEIVIRKSLTLQGTETKRANFPLIKAAPNSRVFTITRLKGTDEPAGGSGTTPRPGPTTAQLSQLELEGCGGACVANGGLILTEDVVSLDKVWLKKGEASVAGGAVYVDINGSLLFAAAQISESKAPRGAAIALAPAPTPAPSAAPAKAILILGGSLVTGNEGNTIIDAGSELSTSAISSATISGNTGLALRIQKGMTLNNVTMVDNTGGGINFGNLAGLSIYNSIVAGNGSAGGGTFDCSNVNTTTTDANVEIRYSLLDSGCGSLITVASGNNAMTTDTPLFAGIKGEKCPKAGPGLLCYLADNGGETQTHKPRLPVKAADQQPLDPEQAISSDYALNLVVNRGSPLSGTSQCAAQDQRSLSQRDGNCDRGAVAVQADNTLKPLVHIISGNAGESDFLTLLGDVELLPGYACFQVDSTQPHANTPGAKFLPDGCFSTARITKAPAKGWIEFDSTTNRIRYIPSRAFHGTDEFTFLVATTLSRNTDPNSDPVLGRFVEVNVKVISEPATGESSKSLDVGGGSLSVVSLFGLAGLLFARRRRLTA